MEDVMFQEAGAVNAITSEGNSGGPVGVEVEERML